MALDSLSRTSENVFARVHNCRRDVLDALLELAVEIAREGREGRRTTTAARPVSEHTAALAVFRIDGTAFMRLWWPLVSELVTSTNPLSVGPFLGAGVAIFLDGPAVSAAFAANGDRATSGRQGHYEHWLPTGATPFTEIHAFTRPAVVVRQCSLRLHPPAFGLMRISRRDRQTFPESPC